VKEESQIEEMRAALRGDRARAEQSKQRTAENVLELGRRPEPAAVGEPEPRKGLLSRLFGR
jgi:hypothetical protein